MPSYDCIDLIGRYFYPDCISHYVLLDNKHEC